MEWTTDRPTKAGFYWLRNFRHKDDEWVTEKPTVVQVHSTMGLPLDVTFTGNDSSFLVDDIAEGEWYGVLEPPA